MYEKVENHLQNQNDLERLELARPCLYFKVDKSWRKIVKSDDWASEIIGALIERWGWSEADIRSLDVRHTWKVDHAMREHKGLVSALTHSYRLLSMFVRENASTAVLSQSDMTILGRKLFTAFELKSGKIDIVIPGVSPYNVDVSITDGNYDISGIRIVGHVPRLNCIRFVFL